MPSLVQKNNSITASYDDDDELGISDSATLLGSESQCKNVEDACDALLMKKGMTAYVVIVIVCSGIGLLSDTLEIMSLSFAKDDISSHFGLSRQEESTLSGALFAGMLVGGLIWGRAADLFGRRRVLLISLSMNGSCAALSALASSFPMFLTARFFSGIGVGGSLPVIFSYVSEWIPRSKKGSVISAVATCWMFGTVLAAGLAWLFLPMTINAAFWKPWRLYLLTCSVPSFAAAIMYCYLDETPLFLIEVGKTGEAVAVLRNFCGGRNFPNLPMEMSVLRRLLEDESSTPQTGVENSWQIFGVIWSFMKGMIDLFYRPLLKTTLLLIAVILPVHFGYYGFMMWLPEYISSHSTDQGQIMPPDQVYKESLYVAISSLPGNMLSILLADRVGPKIILCVSQVLSAGSVFLLWKFDSPDQTIILSCVFNAVTAPVFNMVDILIPALYPTPARGTAFGLHTSLIRIIMISANWFFSLFIDKSPTEPILLTAVLLVISAVTSLFIPPIA